MNSWKRHNKNYTFHVGKYNLIVIEPDHSIYLNGKFYMKAATLLAAKRLAMKRMKVELLEALGEIL